MATRQAIRLMLAAALLAPTPILAAATTDIKASGSAPSFCNISSEGGPITMQISANGDQLSGTGSYSYVANGNAKVVLSRVLQNSPKSAAASIASIELGDLVTNNSSSSEAASDASGGVIRKQGKISASIQQDNSTGLLTAGSYELQATATCTSL
jgi:hypothetical protein